MFIHAVKGFMTKVCMYNVSAVHNSRHYLKFKLVSTDNSTVGDSLPASIVYCTTAVWYCLYGCFYACVVVSLFIHCHVCLTTDSDSGVQVHNLRWIQCCTAHTQCSGGGGDTGERLCYYSDITHLPLLFCRNCYASLIERQAKKWLTSQSMSFTKYSCHSLLLTHSLP